MSRWKALFGALFVLGLSLVVVFCADAVAGKRFLGSPGAAVAAAGVLLMAAGLVGYGTVARWVSGRAWRRLAAQLDRTFGSQGFGRAFGVYRGRHVHIQARRTPSSSDDPGGAETVIGITLERSLQARFTIHVAGSGIASVQVGAEALEEVVTTAGRRTCYRVTGQRDAYLRAVSGSPGLRRRLAGLRARTTIRVCDASITARQPGRSGLERDASYTRSVLDVLSDLAQAIEDRGGP
jgi:hypothetical protein